MPVFRKQLGVVAGLVLAQFAMQPVAAGEALAPAKPGDDWIVTLGAEGRVVPSYEGSSRYVFLPVPLLDIRSADSPRRFTNPRDGLTVGLFSSGSFRAGVTGKAVLPRRQNDDSNLAGLGNVDWAIEVGPFVEYYPVPWLRTRAELRQGIGGHHGVVADISADFIAQLTPKLTWSMGPRASFASASALAPYFSITPAQSLASGLPVYNASGGFRSFGAGTLVRYEWSPEWATHFFAEYDRLADSAANSPLVTLRGSANQVQVGVGATYSFGVKGPKF